MRRSSVPDAPKPDQTALLSSPSALRNRAVISQEVLRLAPAEGRALEIASGTGEHMAHIAPLTPGLHWHPTDIDSARLTCIAARRAELALPNIAPAKHLDATKPGWAKVEGAFELILLVNLLHLISGAEAKTVLSEIADALAPGGMALIYGPFLRDGLPTSEGDAAFHASLQAQDPKIGYKDIADIQATLVAAGLNLRETVPMPANNLLLAAERRV